MEHCDAGLYNVLMKANTTERRYASVSKEKANGATYTPPELARFVASEMLRLVSLPEKGEIRIFDPAVGDGALLFALLEMLPESVVKRCEVSGFDTDPEALKKAAEFLGPSVRLEQRDFLRYVLEGGVNTDLFSVGTGDLFHLVIANPPYVRTQIMGADEAQRIAAGFGLSGRVDLYYPFMLGIAKVLAPDGCAGVITSNRFMTTKSGQAVRREVLSCFNVQGVYDLGDTKLFDAAVLPSVLIAKGISGRQEPLSCGISFSSIYENTDRGGAVPAEGVIDALLRGSGKYSVPDGRVFSVKDGILDNGGQPSGVWRVSGASSDAWLQTVLLRTAMLFKDIGPIRVGVKTTADKVFIRGRQDWDTQGSGRPELLKPLITRDNARRFRMVSPRKGKPDKLILYPHEVREGRRSVVDLADYPKAAAYLQSHRERLEARDYVIKAGRKWYEIWVPQDPAAWASPKMVFPDISEKPTFWIDTEGGVVNGDCYWIRPQHGVSPDLLWLALAVANSTFIEVFYDHRFNNKLYSGRRRFITQYVEEFPLPDPSSENSAEMIRLAKEIHAYPEGSEQAERLDSLVWEAFGLVPKKVPREGDLYLAVDNLPLETTEAVEKV